MTDPTIVTNAPSSTTVDSKSNKPELPVKTLSKLYSAEYADKKKKIDTTSAEITQRNDKIRYLHDIISELNSLIDAKKDHVDLTGQDELLSKLKIAAEELDVKLPEIKLKLNQVEQNLIIGNLTRKTEDWDKQNKTDMQTVEKYTKHLDMLIMLLKSCEKADHQAKIGHARAIKGG